MTKSLLAACALVLASTPTAFAQSSDTATANVNVTVTNNVAVAEFDDITLAEQLPSSPGLFYADEGFCMSATVGSLTATISGSGAGGTLEVANTVSGEIIPLFADFTDQNSTVTNLPVGSSPVTINNVAVPVTCNPGDTPAFLSVGFNITDAPGAPAGDYAGAITVLVSAD